MESIILESKPERCPICASQRVEPTIRDRITKRAKMNCLDCGQKIEVTNWRSV